LSSPDLLYLFLIALVIHVVWCIECYVMTFVVVKEKKKRKTTAISDVPVQSASCENSEVAVESESEPLEETKC